MKKYEYKGFTIERVTRNDYLVTKEGSIYKTKENRIPRTLTEAKALIDTLTA